MASLPASDNEKRDMRKPRATPQQRARETSGRAIANLAAAGAGVTMVKDGDHYRVFKDGSLIGQIWRSSIGAWGYTTTDGHDGFIRLRRISARDALVRRHLKQHHHEANDS
jgi:hypothetical protein